MVLDFREKQNRLMTDFQRVCERRKLRISVGKSKLVKCASEVHGTTYGRDREGGLYRHKLVYRPRGLYRKRMN